MEHCLLSTHSLGISGRIGAGFISSGEGVLSLGTGVFVIVTDLEEDPPTGIPPIFSFNFGIVKGADPSFCKENSHIFVTRSLYIDNHHTSVRFSFSEFFTRV